VVSIAQASDEGGFRPPAKVIIVAGKGGVGKTTVSGALAYLACSSGIETLVVEVEGNSGLPQLFGVDRQLDYDESILLAAGSSGPGSAALRARAVTPDDALTEYLDGHGLRRVSRRLSSTGTLDVVATAVPGLKDLLVLGKVKQIEGLVGSGSLGSPGFIVVDAPAAGHAITFLSSAYGLLDAAAAGPIRQQAADVVSMLSDPQRCQVMLVTLPEETPVNEAADTAFHLEDRAAVKLAPIVVNGLWPHLDLPEDLPFEAVAHLPGGEAGRRAALGAADFRRHRQHLQDRQVARLAELLPLPQLHLPYIFSTELGPADVAQLALALGRAIEGGSHILGDGRGAR
jgi:anion-transporting  ArsA/GET3 family ATPase